MNYKYVVFTDYQEILESNFTIFAGEDVKLFFLYGEYVKYSEYIAKLDKEQVKQYIENNKFLNAGVKDGTIQVFGKDDLYLEHKVIDILLRVYKKGNVAVVVSDPTKYPRLEIFKEIYKEVGFVLNVNKFMAIFGPNAEQNAPEEAVIEKKEEPKEQEEEGFIVKKQEEKPVEQPQEQEEAAIIMNNEEEAAAPEKPVEEEKEEDVFVRKQQPEQKPQEEEPQEEAIIEIKENPAELSEESPKEEPAEVKQEEEAQTVQEEESAPEQKAEEEPQEDEGIIKKQEDESKKEDESVFDFKF